MAAAMANSSSQSNPVRPWRHRHRALDLVDRLLSGKSPTSVQRVEGLTAGDLMSRRVVTASPDDDLRQAARTMIVYSVKRLPVVSEGHLVGLVSRADLMHYFDRPDAAIAADVDRTLASPLSAPECHRIASAVDDGVVHPHRDRPARQRRQGGYWCPVANRGRGRRPRRTGGPRSRAWSRQPAGTVGAVSGVISVGHVDAANPGRAPVIPAE